MTIDETQRRIIEEFSGLGDWLDRYEHLIRLGKAHEPLDDRFKTDEYAMPGCQSQVWIRTEMNDGRLRFHADSDSLIIKGVLVLLLRALDRRAPADVATARLYFLEEIGLTTNLSPTRANGVATIIKHMQRWGAKFGGTT
jgi:cysteine desulfuration protein SufE